LNELLLSH